MSRYGTCAFCIQAMEIHRARRQPHDPQVVELLPQVFSCALLDFCDQPAPPPIARAAMNGIGFPIEPSDCDACVHYRPAGEPLLENLLRSRAKALKRRQKRGKLATKRAI